MPTPRLRLGQLLVDARLITAEALDEVLAAQRTDGRRLGTLLVERGLINETQLTQILSHQLSVPWVSLLHIEFSRQLLNLVPRQVADRFCLVPIYVRHVRHQGDTLYVAMDDPSNEDGLRACREHSGLPVRSMIAPPNDIRSAIRVYYGVDSTPARKEPASAPAEPLPQTEPSPVAPPPPSATPSPTEAQPPSLLGTPSPAAPVAVTRPAPRPELGEVHSPASEPTLESPVDDGGDPHTPASAIDPAPPPAEPELSPAEPELSPAEPALPPAEPALPPAEPAPPPAEPELSPAEPAPAASAVPTSEGPEIEAVEIPVDLSRAERLRGLLEPPLTPPPPSSPQVENIPRPRGRAPRMVSLTLLDGTTINLPAKRRPRRPLAEGAAAEAPRQGPPEPALYTPPPPPGSSDFPGAPDSVHGLTARDLVLALRVVANGADASEVLGENLRWEALFSALLSLMLKKHLIADWEFIDELKKQL